MTSPLGQNSALPSKSGNGINLDKMKADILAGRNALFSKKESLEFGSFEPMEENPNLVNMRRPPVDVFAPVSISGKESQKNPDVAK